MCVRTAPATVSTEGQYKLEYRSRNISVLRQNGTRHCEDRYRHKLKYRSRNTSVMLQAGTRKCWDRYQHKVEYRSQNTSVLYQTGTATPFGMYNIMKSGTSPPRPMTPQPPARKHCTGVPRASRENNFQTNLRAICGNIFSQSCEKQISTKTNA